MLESKIQSQIIKKYESDGYFVLKIIKANKSGIPDLLLIDKKSCVASWVEVKSPTGRISDIQRLRARELRSFGCEVQFLTEGGCPFDEGYIKTIDEF